MDPYSTDPVQHLITSGQDLDDLVRDLVYDLSHLCPIRVKNLSKSVELTADVFCKTADEIHAANRTPSKQAFRFAVSRDVHARDCSRQATQGRYYGGTQ